MCFKQIPQYIYMKITDSKNPKVRVSFYLINIIHKDLWIRLIRTKKNFGQETLQVGRWMDFIRGELENKYDEVSHGISIG